MSLVSNRRLVSFRKVKLTSFYNKLRINTLNLCNIFVDTWDGQQLFLRSSRTFRFHGRCLSYPYVFSVICRSNRSFNIPPGPPPHPPPPRAFDFFENECSNSPLPGPKCRSNARVHSGDQMPPPRDISQAHKWQRDDRNAVSCRTKSL